MWGANASFLDFDISIFDERACLKFWLLTIANFPNNHFTFDIIL